MAAGPSVKVEGAAEFRRAMKHMGGDLRDLTKIHKKAAQPVKDRAQEIAPVRSGTLRRSIRIRATQKAAGILAGKATVPYAGPIHFGWPRRNIESQPFLYDAAEEKRSEVASIYGDFIGDLVKRVERETPG